ncbi:hypothetical protein HK102_012316 [Quaeritorhiza haematococci]|nr:hypothetical protein HK102_012316 [Quaeritorhiza haematococci]
MAAAAKKDKLVIFDTTLRDGEQSPGVTLNADEKVEIARQLSRLGVDVCEAGFPIASQGDFEAVQRIAREVGPLMNGRKSEKPMVIAGLARAVPADIQRAYDAVKEAPLHRIHTFLATSDIHLKYKLKISREECVERATAAVKFAKSLGCHDIEFSPEDAGRSEKEFLCKVLGEVIKAGATTLNIPDTVGYNTPEEYGALMKHLVTHTPGADKVTWSCHCHNDLGLATANTLAGIRNGARQVEVTINGIGERAGNTALEEVVMAIHTHPDSFPVMHQIDTRQIYNTSQLVTKRTGMIIQPNKAIVGANAFAHESGIHQDGVLKNKQTYEIIQPEVIGLPSNALVLGKHSGRNAFRTRIEQLLGHDSPHVEVLKQQPKLFESLFASFKKLADAKKKGVTDQDLHALVDETLRIQSSSSTDSYRLKTVQVVSGSGVLATATVTLEDLTAPKPVSTPSATPMDVGTPDTSSSAVSSPAPTPSTAGPVTGTDRVDAAIGYGPVHAIFSAINRLIGFRNVLASYEVKAVTEGSESLGQVLVRIQEDDESTPSSADDDTSSKHPNDHHSSTTNGSGNVEPPRKKPRLLQTDTSVPAYLSRRETFQGQGTDEDILVASGKAYVNAVNRMIDAKRRKERVERESGVISKQVPV